MTERPALMILLVVMAVAGIVLVVALGDYLTAELPVIGAGADDESADAHEVAHG